ncbi:MAG: DUF5926 family protein [Actinomycetes bacterium]
MAKKVRRPVSGSGAVLDADVPVVGLREPCPCGSGKRYKQCHGRRASAGEVELVSRPFERLPGECDWVALREIVPTATARVRTTREHGDREVVVATVLPMAWPALHRSDGEVLVGLQVQGGSGDPSRDVAHALLQAVASAPGTPVPTVPLTGSGPRLQDVLVLDQPLKVDVHEGFDFWLQEGESEDADVRASLERANSAAVPTDRLTSVEAAYWCRIGGRAHLRWVLPYDEEPLLDALARLHARGESGLGEGTRYIGAFRAHGLLVPVWDLPSGAVVDDVEEPAAAFGDRLAEALADDAPLTADERRARAGVVSRQLTLR